MRLAPTVGYDGFDQGGYKALRTYGMKARPTLSGSELTVDNIIANYELGSDGQPAVLFTTVPLPDDVIERYTEARARKLKLSDHMGSDFWGNPVPPLKVDSPVEPSRPTGGQGGGGTASSTGNDDTKAPPSESKPPEKIEDLQSELEGYIGLTAVKKEVKNLISMAAKGALWRKQQIENRLSDAHPGSSPLWARRHRNPE